LSKSAERGDFKRSLTAMRAAIPANLLQDAGAHPFKLGRRLFSVFTAVFLATSEGRCLDRLHEFRTDPEILYLCA
jgi:hypothetical protein